MRLLFVILLLTNFNNCLSQSLKSQRIDSLKYVKEVPFIGKGNDISGCGDAIFWGIVVKYKNTPMALIDKLNDTTSSKLIVPYDGGYYTVADIAYSALTEIIVGVPNVNSLGIDLDYKGCGSCTYLKFLREDIKNRISFQKEVRIWYNKNKSNLVWVSSNYFTFNDCHLRKKHPNGGHFELKK